MDEGDTTLSRIDSVNHDGRMNINGSTTSSDSNSSDDAISTISDHDEANDEANLNLNDCHCDDQVADTRAEAIADEPYTVEDITAHRAADSSRTVKRRKLLSTAIEYLVKWVSFYYYYSLSVFLIFVISSIASAAFVSNIYIY